MNLGGRVRRESGKECGWRFTNGDRMESGRRIYTYVHVSKNDSSVHMHMVSHSNDVIITITNDIM